MRSFEFAVQFNVGSLSASIGLSSKEIGLDKGKGSYKGNGKGWQHIKGTMKCKYFHIAGQ